MGGIIFSGEGKLLLGRKSGNVPGRPPPPPPPPCMIRERLWKTSRNNNMNDYKFLGSIHIGQFCAVVQVPLEKS